jgi:hypothetical protein
MQHETKSATNKSCTNDDGTHVDGASFRFSSASAKSPPETPVANANAIARRMSAESTRKSSEAG